jgi:hypothetical protein
VLSVFLLFFSGVSLTRRIQPAVPEAVPSEAMSPVGPVSLPPSSVGR